MTGCGDLHQSQPLFSYGAPLNEAQAAVVMLHGRGARAQDILQLAPYLGHEDAVAFLAPQASTNTWYPYSFVAPLEANEPCLSSALLAVTDTLLQVEAVGITDRRTLLLGFSQGACLALEFAARNARPYGGIIGLSGGLIGPDGTPRDYEGDFEQTPVFLGCSDVDPHIQLARVHESADVLARLGAAVTTRIYPGMGHTVIDDELAAVRAMLSDALA
ncbi:MAG: phospholipase [Anaerolineae bacterium]|nr:phospholipase [Anaerolineae bacterium]